MRWLIVSPSSFVWFATQAKYSSLRFAHPVELVMMPFHFPAEDPPPTETEQREMSAHQLYQLAQRQMQSIKQHIQYMMQLMQQMSMEAELTPKQILQARILLDSAGGSRMHANGPSSVSEGGQAHHSTVRKPRIGEAQAHAP